MKNFIDKKYFNMVEIVLALAVVSVAIVSLMGMLPVALRASKNSVADNSVASVVDLMKVRIDGKFNSGFANLKTKIPDSKPSTTGDFEYDTETKYCNDTVLKDYAFQVSGKDGKYLVEFFSGEFDNTSKKFTTTDFQADVRVWRERIMGIYVPYAPKDTAKTINDNFIIKNNETADLFENHGTTVCIEISWPSGIKYENQEHRLYKFDYFAK